MEDYTGLSESEKSCLKKCQAMEAECRDLWIRAIEYSPRLVCYCRHWYDFTPRDWATLLATQSNLINIAPLHLLGFDEWFKILFHQPSLIEYCPLLDDFPQKYWSSLKKLYPWLKRSPKCAKSESNDPPCESD